MIGILDSGLGGLSTLSALRKLSPKTDLLFLADQAHAPYGERSEEELIDYFEKALAFFEKKKVTALLLACGTLSSVALPRLKTPPPFPIFEATSPAADTAARLSKKNVTVLATTASIRSDVYANMLKARGVEEVTQLACPLFVPILEEGCRGDGEVARAVVRHTLSHMHKTPSAVVLLGCTHYGFLSPAIKDEWQKVSLVDSGALLAHHALTCLPHEKGQGRTLLYTTGAPHTFLKKASALLSLPHLTVYGAWER